MRTFVVDIETYGAWDQQSPETQEYLLRNLSPEEAAAEVQRCALSPFTGQVVAIGMRHVETGKMRVLAQHPAIVEPEWTKDEMFYFGNTESDILASFWRFLGPFDRFVTFNGRTFDAPFLMIRSAIHGIKPVRDLVGYRFDFKKNCDLKEALSFNGSINLKQMRFNLDMACRTFGIPSPKASGMSGAGVAAMYEAGRIAEIAQYCLDDVVATCALYEKLAATLLFEALNK